MTRAGTLDFTGVKVGVSAQEIVDIALANVGQAWAGSPAGFAWGVTNLAGLPFFDLRNLTDGPANTFQNPDHWDLGFSGGSPADKYESPHSWDDDNIDGWSPVWSDTSGAEVSDLEAVLRPGDIVRVYDYGNWSEHSEPGCDDVNSHTFIVVGTAGGNIEVVDTWGDGTVVKHNWSDIVAEMTDHGKFQSAYVSRVGDDTSSHIPQTLQGNGYGDWSGIGWNLQVTSAPSAVLTVDGSALKLAFSYRVGNAGSLAVAASHTGIYLSSDATITTADRLLSVDDVAALLAGGSSIETGEITLPGGIAPGTWYVGVIVDYDNAIGELNEADNVSAGTPITIGAADLDVTAKPGLKIVWAGAGGPFTLTYALDNLGNVGAGASHTGIYLSTDSTITAADRLVAVEDVAALAAGASRTQGGTFTLPGDIAGGNYYIGVIADHDNAVSETDEANNPSQATRITIFTDNADKIKVPTGLKAWHALAGDDTLTGTSKRDALYGDGGNDSLLGGKANDTLVGGSGADILHGGAGADFFQFDSAGHIGRTAGHRDIIDDWNPAADYIDLRAIDAKSGVSGNNAFSFVAAAGSAFSGAKGELRWVQKDYAGTAHDKTLVIGDINGDKAADFTLEIKGLHTMHAVDFLL